MEDKKNPAGQEPDEQYQTVEPQSENNEIVQSLRSIKDNEKVEDFQSIEDNEAVQALQPSEENETVQAPQSIEDNEAVQAPQPSEENETVQALQSIEDSEAVQAPQPTEENEAVQAPQPSEENETVQAPQPTKGNGTVQLPQPSNGTAQAPQSIEVQEDRSVETNETEQTESEPSKEIVEKTELPFNADNSSEQVNKEHKNGKIEPSTTESKSPDWVRLEKNLEAEAFTIVPESVEDPNQIEVAELQDEMQLTEVVSEKESKPPEIKQSDNQAFNTTEMKVFNQWSTEAKEEEISDKEASSEKSPSSEAPECKVENQDEHVMPSTELSDTEVKSAIIATESPKATPQSDTSSSGSRRKAILGVIAASLILVGSIGVGAYALNGTKGNPFKAVTPQVIAVKPKPAMFQLYLDNQKFEVDLTKFGYNGKDSSSIDQKQLRLWLDEVKKKVDQSPVNADLVRFDQMSKLKSEKPGHYMDTKTMNEWLKDLTPYINKPQEIPIIVAKPTVTAEDIRRVNKKLIGRYRTVFDPGNVNRATNIKLASRAINGLILMPGKRFSFNKVVGKRTTSKGYKPAHVIVNGEFSEGIGGGICQVSSTLYNSVDRANLRVTAIQHHSLDVTYVPKGRDATVSWGGPDFRFVNNLNKPILIKINVNGGTITVNIYTTPDAKVSKEKQVQEAPQSFSQIKEVEVDPTKPTDNLPKSDRDTSSDK